MVKVIYYYYSN